MLFTDSNIVTVADLAQIDSGVTTVASAEQMDINATIAQAWSECADQILDATQAYGGICSSVGSHYAHDVAVLNVGAGASSRSRIRLNQVVVSSSYQQRSSPIKTFVAYKTLALFYRDAANRSSEDQYDKKFDTYSVEAKKRWATLFTQGLPIAIAPLDAPGSLHAFNPGTWDDSNVAGDGFSNNGGSSGDPVDNGGDPVGSETMTPINGVATPYPASGTVHVLNSGPGITIAGPATIPTGAFSIEVVNGSVAYPPAFSGAYESADAMSAGCNVPNARISINLRRLNGSGLYSVQYIATAFL